MNSASPPPPPAPPEDSDEGSALERLEDCLLDLSNSVDSRFEAVREAYKQLRDGRVSIHQDNPRRRLVAFVGYDPKPAQQAELFAALAAWHATFPRLTENRSASYSTRKGSVISYGYADLAGVVAVAQTAAVHGLSALSCQEFDDTGTAVVTAYLLHSGGGAIGSGPVPLYVAESDRPGQAHSAGLTTCRRLALQMVLGLAAERDDDFNASDETRGRNEAVIPNAKQGGPQPPMRLPPNSSRAALSRPGPPPNWLSKEQRQSLEAELQSPGITPARFQEIEDRLAAARRSVRS
jgi:hypothetical protein